jgi:hypothetical protein
MPTKVIEINICSDCPNHEAMGRENYCRETGRLLKSQTLKIPSDCPLPGLKN